MRRLVGGPASVREVSNASSLWLGPSGPDVSVKVGRLSHRGPQVVRFSITHDASLPRGPMNVTVGFPKLQHDNLGQDPQTSALWIRPQTPPDVRPARVPPIFLAARRSTLVFALIERIERVSAEGALLRLGCGYLRNIVSLRAFASTVSSRELSNAAVENSNQRNLPAHRCCTATVTCPARLSEKVVCRPVRPRLASMSLQGPCEDKRNPSSE